LLKDPFAVFSAPWFASRLGCEVVITVRHPAAFASSLKRLGWNFQHEDLLAQPLLMRDWLDPFRDEMERVDPGDLIGRAGLLWKMIYTVVDEYRRQYPQFLIVSHETLSLDPMHGFRALYSALDLTFTSKAQLAVLNASSDENPKEVSAGAVHAFRVDSRANLQNWKNRLVNEEVDRLRQLTDGVVERFYPEASWE
jgi:hypothetical protein